MNTDYLSKNGDLLSFASLEEFEATIASLDVNVPFRNSGRRSFHRERFCAVRYLDAAVHCSGISFPFSICKGERPDFVITLNDGKTIGLEHSDITTEDWQQALTQIAKSLKQEQVLFGRLSNDDLTPDEACSAWASLALATLEKKIHSINEPDYRNLDTYELLLYSNTDLPNVAQHQVMPRLSDAFNNKYRSTAFPRLFSSITVFYGDELWFRTLQLFNADATVHSL